MGQSRQIMFDLSPLIVLGSSRRGSQPPQGIMAPRRDLSPETMWGLKWAMVYKQTPFERSEHASRRLISGIDIIDRAYQPEPTKNDPTYLPLKPSVSPQSSEPSSLSTRTQGAMQRDDSGLWRYGWRRGVLGHAAMSGAVVGVSGGRIKNGGYRVRPHRGAHDRARVRKEKSSETRINTVYFINCLLESRRGITVPRLFRVHRIAFRRKNHP